MLQHLVDVEQLGIRRTVRPQHAVHQVLQAIDLTDDDPGVLTVLAVRIFSFQQLRRATDAAQRILDFVGHAADQLARGLVLAEHQFVARDAPVAVQRHDLQQQARLAAEQHRRHRAIGGHRRLAIAGQAHFPLYESAAGVQRVLQAAHIGTEVRNPDRQRHPYGMPAADAQQTLAGGIQGRDAQLTVQGHHGGSDAVEYGLGLDPGSWAEAHAHKQARSRPKRRRRSLTNQSQQCTFLVRRTVLVRSADQRAGRGTVGGFM